MVRNNSYKIKNKYLRNIPEMSRHSAMGSGKSWDVVQVPPAPAVNMMLPVPVNDPLLPKT